MVARIGLSMFGFQPWYEPLDSAFAPCSVKILRMSSASLSLSSSTRPRCSEQVTILPFSNFTRARFDDVSTVPSKSFDIPMTPLGYLAMASSMFLKVLLSITSAGISAASIEMARSGSVSAYCSFVAVLYSSTNFFILSALSAGTTTVANDSLGMALRKLPPLIVARRTPNFCAVMISRVFMSLLALPLPRLMSMPE